jgi:hypothetical protein
VHTAPNRLLFFTLSSPSPLCVVEIKYEAIFIYDAFHDHCQCGARRHGSPRHPRFLAGRQLLSRNEAPGAGRAMLQEPLLPSELGRKSVSSPIERPRLHANGMRTATLFRFRKRSGDLISHTNETCVRRDEACDRYVRRNAPKGDFFCKNRWLGN